MTRAKLVAIIVGVVAVAFIVIGVVTGQPDGVFGKAINICLECIGIG